MDKHYIVINLNKAESAETRQARVRERVRWGVFGVLIVLLLGVNVRVWMISSGYDGIIDKKEKEISRLKDEINKLQSQGKNLSKDDILSFAELEQVDGAKVAEAQGGERGRDGGCAARLWRRYQPS